MRAIQQWCGLTLVAWAMMGCQQAATPTTTANNEQGEGAPADAEGNIIPVASISAQPIEKPLKKLDGMELEEDPEMAEDDVEIIDDPQPGTPEFTLREVAQLRFQPIPTTDDRDQARQFRKERNDKIIDLTATVIKQTYKNEKKQRIFEVAVNYMLEARLELALQGDKEAIEAIYDDAASLWERDPKSKPAADAAYTLVSLAYTNARNTTSKDNKWLGEFNRQAINFARNFPQETTRGLTMLFTAARSCELHGLSKPAIEAYTQLQQIYPQSTQAMRAKGVIRRLQLPGQSVKLGGPTIDGGYLGMEDVAGKTVLLVFWSSQAKPFLDDLPALQEFQKAYARQGLTLVGVCLDEDQAATEKFVNDHKIAWPQIFYNEPGKKGWNNPIATYYGVQDVSNWLIDSHGAVVSTSVKVAELEDQLSKLSGPATNRTSKKPGLQRQ